jgi:hypothetical protein
MDNRTTVLEQIIEEVAVELFNKWIHALPDSEMTEENIEMLRKNSGEHTRFVVKNFVEKFNAAAEELKAQPDEQ